MSSYADLRKAAEATVDDDALKPLAEQHVRFDKKLTRVLANGSIPLTTRKAVLDKLDTDVDNIGEAHYSNRGALARRADGGLALFAGGNTSNPVLQALQTVAEHTGFTPEQLVGMFQPLLNLNQGDSQLRARLIAAAGVLRAAKGYEVKNDGTTVKSAEYDELSNEFEQYKRDHPAKPATTTVTAHQLDGVHTKFDRIPDDKKAPVVIALDKLVSRPDLFVNSDGKIVGDDNAGYRAVLNEILAATKVDEPLELRDGIIGSRKETFTVVDRSKISEDTQRFVRWIK